MASTKVKDKKKPLTVKIELHKVNPYTIMWVGEKTFSRKGQEETFVRFTIDKDGNQIGDFSYREKKFVVPYVRSGMISAPDIIVDEPAGAAAIGSGTEESHYGAEGVGGSTGF